MDTMKILLGATIAVLLFALAASWQAMTHGVANAPQDELARLKKQVNELRAEQDKLELEKQMQQLRSDPVQSPVNAELEAARLQLAQNKAELEELELQKTASRDKKVADEEELLLDQRKVENTDSELRRARMISEALLMGRVQEYVEDPQYGGFITFDVLMPEQVQAGVIVAVRRKTGILGQFKVSEVTAEGAIASPLPGFNDIKPQQGDELILPPQY